MVKTALVTGATSGIGEATVRALATAGWRVVATGRRADRLQRLASELGAAVHAAAFDVRDAAAVDTALAALPAEFAAMDLLVNNAGLALGTAPAQSARLDDWRTMIDTNVTALVSITHARCRGSSSGVERSSTWPRSRAPTRTPAATCTAPPRRFVQQFTLNLRSDLHGTGVRVSAIDPGMVETEFTLIRTGGDQAASDRLYQGSDPMTAQDIAATVLWIAQLPPHLNINQLELMPVSQSFAGFQVARETTA